MIRTIAVHPGDSVCAKAAVRHAAELAKLFGARVRVVGTWQARYDDSDVAEEDATAIIEKEVAVLVKELQDGGVDAEASPRGEELQAALLDEARESDLLVLGFPPQGSVQEDPVAAMMQKKSFPFVRKAESCVMIVSDIPCKIEKVLVNAGPVPEGKAAMRLAGEIAERSNAELAVAIASGRNEEESDVIAAGISRYLEAFKIPRVSMLQYEGEQRSSATILSGVADAAPDMVVLGAPTYGKLSGFFGKAGAAEDVIRNVSVPVLIARY